ncbi:unnamed protein product [Caenorhabditis bovis]|uniref:SUN domain-containing protein n=1 Tax=Caenorhabditis bovis TaxID=2654633 RepID=A0A8S1F0Q4_9PELO|nr:unnamed protein product [Caenorhabditis bovis]
MILYLNYSFAFTKQTSPRKNWKEFFLPQHEQNKCTSIQECQNSLKCKGEKVFVSKPKEKKTREEKVGDNKPPIDNFDEWTKKRRDAVANQNHVLLKDDKEAAKNGIRRVEIPEVQPLSSPNRNFASKECGAKVIAANSEAENAKAVVNDKDLDDYMRNPCDQAKEKFIVIELCEPILVKKLAIGNFELFASRPKQISVYISERYPPLASWTFLGKFQLQDYHKKLQTFEVPEIKLYAKFIRIDFEKHYGKEHYCVVSVVNVIGTTLADEYEKEEAAAQILNSLNGEPRKDVVGSTELVTNTPIIESKMQTQLPIPPKKAPLNTYQLSYNSFMNNCRQCSNSPANVTYYICWLFEPVNFESVKGTSVFSVPFTKFGISPSMSKQATFDQSRRRNIASIQNYFSKLNGKGVSRRAANDSIVNPTKENPDEKTPSSMKPTHENVESDSKKEAVKIVPIDPINATPHGRIDDKIVPAGGSSNQREMVLIKLSKRIAAVEMNLTLSTEYLSELSKQYVSQMSGYRQELEETRRFAKTIADHTAMMMRSKINALRREVSQVRNLVSQLERVEKKLNHEIHLQRILAPSCHIPPSFFTNKRMSSMPPLIEHIEANNPAENVIKSFLQNFYNYLSSLQVDNFTYTLLASNILTILILNCWFNQKLSKCYRTIEETLKLELVEQCSKLTRMNRKLIARRMRKAELSVTVALSSSMKAKKRASNSRNSVARFEVALKKLLNNQEAKIAEQLEANSKLLAKVLLANEGVKETRDHLKSVVDG